MSNVSVDDAGASPYTSLRMKLRAALVSLSCIAACGAQEATSTLLGKWRSVVISKGGIGAVIDFHSDGTFDYMPGAVLGGRYRIENNRIITVFENGDPEEVETIGAVSAGALRLVGSKPQQQLSFKRVGGVEDVDHLLIGTWVSTTTMPGLPAHGYYYFRRDGRETFFIPFRTDHCSYSVSGDRIRLTNRQGSKVGSMRWDGQILTLPWGRGDATFERF